MPTFWSLTQKTDNEQLEWLKGKLELISEEQQKPVKCLSRVERIVRLIRARNSVWPVPLASLALTLARPGLLSKFVGPRGVDLVNMLLASLSLIIVPPADYLLDLE